MNKLLFPILMIVILISGCITVAPPSESGERSPIASIDSIASAAISAGVMVSFEGHGTDPDGTITAYNWRSSLDGDLSNDASFSSSSLSLGVHTIYFKVQDNDGNWSNEVSEQITISDIAASEEVAETPVISSFAANPDSVNSGESSTLIWNVTDATTVSIDQGIGDVALTGTRMVSPGTTTTFTLTATNSAGTVTESAVVNVEEVIAPVVGPPVVVAFQANPGNVDAGDSATLLWNVTGADSVTIDHGIGDVAVAGTKIVSVDETTTYTLTATNSADSVTQSVTVNVGLFFIPLIPFNPAISFIQDKVLDPVANETGSVYSTGQRVSDTVAGDTGSDTTIRAYFSFDISSLSGKTISKAVLKFKTQDIVRKPWPDLTKLWVGVVNYGVGPLQSSDYGLSSSPISSFTAPPGDVDVTAAVQAAVNAGKPRFQIRNHFSKFTDSDGLADYIKWSNATLTISYY